MTDFATQSAELMRRRKLMEVLGQSSQEAPIRGNTAQALGQVLTKLGTAYITNKNQKEIAGEEAANRAASQQALEAEARQYADQSAAGGNQREAMIKAMTSQFPEMQALGRSSIAAMGKAPEIKQHVIRGKLVEGVPGQAPRVVGDYPAAQDDFSPMETRTGPDGKPMMGQVNLRTKEFHVKGGSGQTFNIGDKQDNMLFEPALKNMAGSRETVIKEQKNLDSAQRIYELSQDPQLISGAFATPLAFLSGVGAKLGLNGPEAAAKTQAMLTDLAGNALARGQEMKGSFSDADIQFLKDVTAGKLEASPQTMRQVAALAYSASHNAILGATEMYSGNKGISEMTQRASAMYPMPPIRHKNLDPKLFTDDEVTGRMRYNSPLTAPKSGKASEPISWRDWKP